MPNSENRQKTRIIALRLTPAERARLQGAADVLGISLSRFVRDSAMSRATERPEALCAPLPSPGGTHTNPAPNVVSGGSGVAETTQGEPT